ncbi:MAG: nicotinate-nucleotide diphosphorylase [Planctomycetes bacterium]|nr:nicotinate-nucleotide diphosphorylase [Planctomycetota bacterium]
MGCMWSEQTLQLIEIACEEDLGATGDITSALLEGDEPVEARLVPRADGVICGLAIGPAICDVFAQRSGFELAFATPTRDDGPGRDGFVVRPGECVATIRGRRTVVLCSERTLLNFLGRMSGVATLTRRFVDAAREVNADVQIVDTRKTIPGWRELDKYAVRCGGAQNHRQGLYDAVLIKDNHLAGTPPERLASALFDMLNRLVPLSAKSEASPDQQARGLHPGRPSFVEVEVDDLAQFEAVCSVLGVDIVLLDNFSPAQMRAAVERRDALGLRGKVRLEASGRVTLDNVAEIAATGVDRIAVGALTHSAPTLDIGLDF